MAKAKQADLIEGRGIEELDMAASALKETRTQRMALLKEEIKLADELLQLMRQRKLLKYVYDENRVDVVPGKEKVTVHSLKEAK